MNDAMNDAIDDTLMTQKSQSLVKGRLTEANRLKQKDERQLKVTMKCKFVSFRSAWIELWPLTLFLKVYVFVLVPTPNCHPHM